MKPLHAGQAIAKGDGAPDPGRWFALFACSLGFFMANVHRISPGVFAAELMQEFNTSASVLGLLSSSYFYTYAILQIPVGLLCDRYKPGLIMSYFLIAGVAGAVVFAASTTLMMAVIGRVVLSAGVSATFISALRIFDFAFKQKGFSMATGIMVAAGGLGGVFAQGPLAVAVLEFGWRNSMYAIALVTVFVAVLAFMATGKYERTKPSEKVGAGLKKGFSLTEGRRDYMIMLYGLSFALMIQYGSLMGYQGLWGIPFLTDVYGLTKTSASSIMMLASIGAIIGSPLTGWLLDGKGMSAHKMMLWSASIFLLSWLPLIVKLQGGFIVPIALASFFMGGGSTMTAILNPTYSNRYISDDLRGRFFGILNSASIIGAAIIQPLMGLLIDTSLSSGRGLMVGYLWSFRLGFACAIIVLVTRIAIYRKFGGLKDGRALQQVG